MAEHLVTGYAGVGHVTSADAGLFNAGVCGSGRYVMESSGQFQYTLESNNLIKIGSGDLVDQGRHITIAPNTEVELAIDNGSQGKKRIDTVVMRYSKDISTGIESAALMILKGTDVDSSGKPSPAALVQGDIFQGAVTDDMPLYYIDIADLQVTGVRKAFKTIPPISDIFSKVYPIGAVYISVSNINPGTLFGGTWARIRGRFLFAEDDDHAVNSTGGALTHALTVDEMPAHTHKGPSHTHYGASHTHSTPNHTHTVTISESGNHRHGVYRNKQGAAGTARYISQGGDGVTTFNSEAAGAHTHTATVKSGGGGTTGAAGNLATSAAGTGNTSSTGGGARFSIMPLYVTVYMWKRTA